MAKPPLLDPAQVQWVAERVADWLARFISARTEPVPPLTDIPIAISAEEPERAGHKEPARLTPPPYPTSSHLQIPPGWAWQQAPPAPDSIERGDAPLPSPAAPRPTKRKQYGSQKRNIVLTGDPSTDAPLLIRLIKPIIHQYPEERRPALLAAIREALRSKRRPGPTRSPELTAAETLLESSEFIAKVKAKHPSVATRRELRPFLMAEVIKELKIPPERRATFKAGLRQRKKRKLRKKLKNKPKKSNKRASVTPVLSRAKKV